MNEQVVGYLCCLVSVLGFGSNYIPVKKIDVKDGVFFTLCLSIGVCIVGLIEWAVLGFYKFEPLAMLGGVIWAVGNACVPFVIKNCGLGTGQLVWSVTNMSTGWATGTFGWFGKNVDKVEHFGMNVAGVLLVILSLAPFAFMRQEGQADPDHVAEAKSRSRLMPTNSAGDGSPGGAELPRLSTDEERALHSSSVGPSTSLKFVYGFVVALVAGVFMGSNFDPPTYLQQLGPAHGHSKDAMDYVISHFSGIFCASLLYFLVYLAMNGRRSFYGREVVLPGIGSGLLWGIAQVGWFKANGILSYVVAFPIIVSVPGVMAAIWGIVLFGENRGCRNLSLLGLVILLQGVGVIIVALSKGDA